MRRFFITFGTLAVMPIASFGQTSVDQIPDLNSLQQIDSDIRQINYSMNDPGGSATPIKVVVQFNCATGLYKLISMSEGSNAIPIYDDERWMTIGDDVRDRQLFQTACGEDGSRLLQNSPAPKYPATALREAREGTARYRITISPNGMVTNCEITATSGHADLDVATCEYARRRASAIPQPTTNSERYYESRVSWRLPK